MISKANPQRKPKLILIDRINIGLSLDKKNVIPDNIQTTLLERKSILEEVVLIPLTDKNGIEKFVKVSKSSYNSIENIRKYKWCVTNDGYPFNVAIGRLHRVVMNVEVGENKIVDHIDRDKLNACLSNLRVTTLSENAFNRGRNTNNTSGITGVNYHKGNNLWRAQIEKDGKRKHIGYYKTKEDAIEARKLSEIEYYGKPLVNHVQNDIKIVKLNNHIRDGIGYIGLTGRNGLGKYALVSIEDFDNCGRVNWNIANGYAWNSKEGYMHRYLVKAEKNLIVDHKNRNQLDNRMDNLRITTYSQNGFNKSIPTNNTSGYRGIRSVGDSSKSKFQAYITYNRKQISKYCSTLEEALIWRKQKELELFGENVF